MFTRALLAFLALPGVVAFLVPALLAAPSWPPTGYRTLGIPLMLAGLATLLGCVRDFYRTGRGTLATWDPPRRLVTVGLYRFTRNPMYVSVLVLLLGWTVTAQSYALLLYAVVVALVFHAHVVLVEEPWASRGFGEEWRSYQRVVPRWLGRRKKRQGD